MPPALTPATEAAPRPLTAKQAAVLDWIREFKDKHGYSPNWREIGAAFGLRSVNSVTGYLKTLRARGYVDWENGKARTLHITAQGQAVVSQNPHKGS